MTEPRRLGRRDFVALVIGGAAGPFLVDCSSDTAGAAQGLDASADGFGPAPDAVVLEQPDVPVGSPDAPTPDAPSTPDVTVSDTADDAAGSDVEGDTPGPDVPAEPAFNLDDVAIDEAAFGTAVQAGTPAQGSMALWCHTTVAAPTVLLWPEGSGKSAVVSLVVAPVEGYAKVKATGLTPGVRYRYAFVSGTLDAPASRSIDGAFLVPHAPGTKPTVIAAATSCTKWWYQPYQALSVTAAHGFDVFLHLGDMSYNDDAKTLAEYRERWLDTIADPGYRDLLNAGAVLQTWDDHEIANNDWTELPPEQIAAGKQAFFEALALMPEVEGRLWRSVRYGDTVEFFVLDCRSERKPETRSTPAAEFISPAQMSWLQGALTASPCAFKVIMNSVPIVAFPPIWPTKDIWAGYPAQRDALLDHITKNAITGVLFVSGDHHFGSLHRVERTGDRSGLYEILAGPGAATPNPLIGALDLAPDLKELTVPSDQFLYYSLRYAATYLTFDPDQLSVAIQFVDAATSETIFEKTLAF